jgi:hypothetical protein
VRAGTSGMALVEIRDGTMASNAINGVYACS